MQKNTPNNNDIFNGRNRAIPKNPLSINKKLALLKSKAQTDDRTGYSSRNY